MFKLNTFRNDGAFWPLAQRPDLAAARAVPWRMLKAILAELAARRAADRLAGLDDRMLRDIGIERGQIQHATRHGRNALAQSQAVRWL